jgi:Flp pilus assembly protein TadG
MTTWWRSTDRQRGSISLMVAVLGVALLVAIGLVVDGGRYVTASQLADNAAAEAGRAAGQHIASPAVLGRQPEVDTARAVEAARDYLAAAGVDGTVTVTGAEITITANVERTPVLLTVAGVRTIAATGSATVRLVRG